MSRYRILHAIEADRLIVTIVKVGNRKDVYRREKGDTLLFRLEKKGTLSFSA